jgi:hypothetical protein
VPVFLSFPLTVGVSGLFYIKVEKKGIDFDGDHIILFSLHLYSGALDIGSLELAIVAQLFFGCALMIFGF